MLLLCFTQLDLNVTLCISFIFSIAFFQFLKGLRSMFLQFYEEKLPSSYKTLQKAPWKISSNVSQVKLSSPFLLYFRLLVTGWYFLLHYSLISSQNGYSLFLQSQSMSQAVVKMKSTAINLTLSAWSHKEMINCPR